MYHFSWFFLIPGVEHGEVLHALESLPGHAHGELANAHVIPAAWTVFVILTIVALAARSGLNAARAKGGVEQYIPADNLGARNVMEILTSGLFNFCENIIGRRDLTMKYFPLLGGIFLYVFFSNFLGVIPGFLPPTSSISNNFAMALVVFLVFNYAGLKENGFNYIKHLAGPMPALAILIFPVEVLSLVLRPVTLSVRLYINMFADHLLLGVSSDLVPLIVPAGFVGLGMFVSMVQAFVFTLLTTIYIALSVAHEDHGDAHADDHGHGHDHDHAHAH